MRRARTLPQKLARRRVPDREKAAADPGEA
jgi:hypothetical protein